MQHSHRLVGGPNEVSVIEQLIGSLFDLPWSKEAIYDIRSLSNRLSP